MRSERGRPACNRRNKLPSVPAPASTLRRTRLLHACARRQDHEIRGNAAAVGAYRFVRVHTGDTGTGAQLHAAGLQQRFRPRQRPRREAAADTLARVYDRDGVARLRRFLGKEQSREAILPMANRAYRESSPTLQRTHQITSLLPHRNPDEKPNLRVDSVFALSTDLPGLTSPNARQSIPSGSVR